MLITNEKSKSLYVNYKKIAFLNIVRSKYIYY